MGALSLYITTGFPMPYSCTHITLLRPSLQCHRLMFEQGSLDSASSQHTWVHFPTCTHSVLSAGETWADNCLLFLLWVILSWGPGPAWPRSSSAGLLSTPCASVLAAVCSSGRWSVGSGSGALSPPESIYNPRENFLDPNPDHKSHLLVGRPEAA